MTGVGVWTLQQGLGFFLGGGGAVAVHNNLCII